MHAFDGQTDRRRDIAIQRLQRHKNWLRLHSKPPAVMEIHILDPTVSRLHRPNVSIYKQSVHGITVTLLLIILSGTFLVTNTIWTKKWNYDYSRFKKNASNLPLSIFSCSSPVPPHSKSGRARVPPGYASVPLVTTADARYLCGSWACLQWKQ